MDMTVRIYSKNDSWTDRLNDGELDEMIIEYLKREYVKEGDIIDSITIENIGM